MCLAVWTAACVVKEPLEDTESGTSGSGATTGASATETTGDATSGGTGGTVDPTGGQATETGEGPVPAACGAADPEASAQFELALVGWPEDTTTDHDVDVGCTVDAVTLDATALTCDVDGVPLPATLTLAQASGEVAWAKGDSVKLRAKSVGDTELGLGLFRSLSLRAVDDSLLVVGVEDESLHEGLFAPLTLQTQLACGPEDFDAVSPIPFQIDFSLEGGESLSLIGGHRGALVIDADFRYAIDVAEASTNNCCHFVRWHNVLLRKVQTSIND